MNENKYPKQSLGKDKAIELSKTELWKGLSHREIASSSKEMNEDQKHEGREEPQLSVCPECGAALKDKGSGLQCYQRGCGWNPDALTPFEWQRLRDWFLNAKRKPSHLAFTAGAARDAASAFEAAKAISNLSRKG